MMIDKKLKDKKVILWMALVVVLFVMKLINVPMSVRVLCLVITSSVYLCLAWKEHRLLKWEVPVLALGLIARIAFCYLDVFTEFICQLVVEMMVLHF